MSIESPSFSAPVAEKPNDTPLDPETTFVQSLDNEDNFGFGFNPEASAPIEVTSETLPPASKRERGIRRVADFLMDASNVLSDRAEQTGIKDRQDAAFDTYSENIDATKSREKSENAAERAENRAEKIEQTRNVLRGIGRGARGLVLRAGIELRYGAAVAGDTLKTAKSYTIGAAEEVSDRIYDTADKVSSKISEVKTAVSEQIDSAKSAAEKAKENAQREALLIAGEIYGAGQKAAEFATDKKDALVKQYQGAKSAVEGFTKDKMDKIGNFFAEKKAAAESRKTARLEARAAAKATAEAEKAAAEKILLDKITTAAEQAAVEKAAREKQKLVLKRAANVELLKRLDQREANKQANKSERNERLNEKRNQRALKIGQAATKFRAAKTAARVGVNTARDTYKALN